MQSLLWSPLGVLPVVLVQVELLWRLYALCLVIVERHFLLKEESDQQKVSANTCSTKPLLSQKEQRRKHEQHLSSNAAAQHAFWIRAYVQVHLKNILFKHKLLKDGSSEATCPSVRVNLFRQHLNQLPLEFMYHRLINHIPREAPCCHHWCQPQFSEKKSLCPCSCIPLAGYNDI